MSSPLRGAPWIAVADAVRGPGDRVARVRLAVPMDDDLAREAAAAWWRDDEVVAWVDGDVVAERQERLGAIVLARRPLRNPDPIAVAAAVRDGIAAEGLDLLRWDDAATSLRARLAFLHAALGDPWPAVDDASLLARLDEWLDLSPRAPPRRPRPGEGGAGAAPADAVVAGRAGSTSSRRRGSRRRAAAG